MLLYTSIILQINLLNLYIIFYRYLHSTGHTYGRPIEGQHEISGHRYVSDNNLWKAMVSRGMILIIIVFQLLL